MLLTAEVLLLAAWLCLALFLPYRSCRSWRLQRLFRPLAAHGPASIFFVGMVAFSLAALASYLGWPEPRIHDEFSYLLAADTFCHGRLTNAPHPLAIYFETFHVIQRPTYCSMYPPAQGLVLACGWMMFGHPLAGVWLGFALACAATCWMLRAWLPPEWALGGALLATLRIGFFGNDAYWSQSYWGGSVAMLGGALVMGAARRLTRSQRTFDGTILALGLAILANSRPFEGAILGFVVAIYLLYVFQRSPSRIGWLGAAVSCVGVLIMAACWTLYYNSRLTGQALLMPYVLHGRSNSMAPLFIWQPLSAEPDFHHAAIRSYHLDWAVPAYEHERTFEGYLHELARRIRSFAGFYLGPFLLVALAALPWSWRKSALRFPFTCLAATACALAVTTWFQPHYAAPAASLVFLIVTDGLRRLRLCRWHGKRVGATLVATLPFFYAALFLCYLVLPRANLETWPFERAELLARLEKEGGTHLIVVRYGPDHDAHREWVFNGADIDGSPVIWARDMASDGNAALLSYYGDRHIWLLDADREPAELKPYVSSAD
jgi:hypothetical protein